MIVIRTGMMLVRVMVRVNLVKKCVELIIPPPIVTIAVIINKIIDAPINDRFGDEWS